MSAASPIPLPAHIAKYELLEFLGGGMSHVFRARDTVLGRTVAIKILTPAGVADTDCKARFLHEARTASNISHENILAVYDFGEDDGRPYMVMEFLRGRTLRTAIHDQMLPDLAGKLRIAVQVARALDYVHQNQIIHRDVKPENINVDDGGRAKLMDFGIAKMADLSLTQPGYVLGTPYYMAPEQITGAPVTPSVDIYAFGIMLYEMLLGTRPYGGDSIETVFYKVMHEPLDLSPLAMAGVPSECVAIVARCTKKNPAERYPDFSGVANDLENALGSQTAPRLAETNANIPPAGHKSKLPLFAALGGALLLIGAASLFLLPRKTEAPPPPKPVLQTRIETPTGIMRLVPAGTFLAGEKNLQAETGAFYVDETEVSNDAYARFCAATHHALPAGFNAHETKLPVVNITLADADAFAAWAGKRLPSAKEWEKAARGVHGRVYPWGEMKDPRLAGVADNPDLKPPKLQPVDAFAGSASEFGAINMIGNAWELVEDSIQPSAAAVKNFAGLSPPATATEPWVSIRGGSFKTPLDPQLSWDFEAIPARLTLDDLGFRCVKDAK